MAPHFRYYLRVRYAECDAQKVVFNSRYSDYVDISTNEFLRAVGLGEAVVSGELDFQLVKQTIEWKAPARFDQILEISVYASHLGNTSFTLKAEFRIANNERIFAYGGNRLRDGGPARPDQDAIARSTSEIKNTFPGFIMTARHQKLSDHTPQCILRHFLSPPISYQCTPLLGSQVGSATSL